MNDKLKRAVNAFYDVSAVTTDTDRIYQVIKICCVCGEPLHGRFTMHKVIHIKAGNRPVCDVCTKRLTCLAHMTYKQYRGGVSYDCDARVLQHSPLD